MSFLRRLVQARAAGSCALMANFSDLVLAAREDALPILLIALDDVLDLDHVQHSSALLLWTARPMVAEFIAMQWAARENERNESRVRARLYGEMTATYAVINRNNVEDRNQAREQLLRMLTQYAPTVAQIRQLVMEIIRRCAICPRGRANRAECMPFIPQIEQANLTLQKLRFFELRGQVIPSAIFLHQATRDLWDNLARLDTAYIPIQQGDVNLELVEDLRNVWITFGEDTVLGFYEGLALMNRNRMRCLIAGACFTYLVSLTKEANVTPAWVARRRAQFQAVIPDLALEDYVSDEICKHYSIMYPKSAQSSQQVYRQLIMSWSHMTTQNVMPLSWIIEQSANSNITSFSTIADVISKLSYINIEYLIARQVPLSNFVNFVTLAKEVLRDPFSVIVKPSINLRQYADIAFICTFIKKELIKDTAFQGYRGQSAAMCNLSEATLKLLAADIWRLSSEIFSRLEDLNAVYTEAMRTSGDIVQVIGGDIFRIPNMRAVQGAPGAMNQHIQRGGEQEPEIVELNAQGGGPAIVGPTREELQYLRSDWPRAARNLPPTAVRVTHEEMVAKIKAQLDARSTAFKNICAEIHNKNIQTRLIVIPDNSVTIPDSFRSIPAQIRDDIMLFGVDVPAAWVEPIPEPNFIVTDKTLEMSQTIKAARDTLVHHAPQNPPANHPVADLVNLGIPLVPGVAPAIPAQPPLRRPNENPPGANNQQPAQPPNQGEDWDNDDQ